MEYTETNKLIAEFMGGTYLPISEHYILPDMVSYLPEDMQYHTSWDWLMPVVERIEGLGYCVQIASEPYYNDEKDTFERNRLQQVCRITKGYVQKINSASFDREDKRDCKLTATYTAVVQFITWYNSKS